MDFINEATLLSAGAVALAVQFLKLKIFPLDFANKYPVPTNIAVSVVAAIVAVSQTKVDADTWTEWAGLVGTVAVLAAIIYNQLLSRWSELKASEGYRND